MRTLDDLDVKGRRVLVRADLNVPLDGETITDPGRMDSTISRVTISVARSISSGEFQLSSTYSNRNASPTPINSPSTSARRPLRTGLGVTGASGTTARRPTSPRRLGTTRRPRPPTR